MGSTQMQMQMQMHIVLLAAVDLSFIHSSMRNMSSSSSSAMFISPRDLPCGVRSCSCIFTSRSSEIGCVTGCIPRGLNTVGVELWTRSLLANWYCSGKGGTGGTSGDICVGLVRGVPKFNNSAAAARPPSSVPAVEGRWSLVGNLCGVNPGDAALSAKELDGMER